ncbi:hypothetical protein [Mariniblastus fucicola]|uniref:Outer membrane lipoprotein-sorting protein n=1 Tax=Mariniblastus fucicola TaxID=980251 RepID=A0A5B9PGB2_9BACT|nr:hypothetical protein [Mariniblastus fucicola]QEG23636.1 hypothetical protein MFFC18_35370 [Mariniblastus fucicola]
MKLGIHFALLLSISWPAVTLGQGFETIVKDIVSERAKVVSYHALITGEIEGEPEKVKLSDGSVHVRKRIPVGFTLELALDQESKRRLIARRDHFQVKATGEEEFSRWYVYVETPLSKIYYNDVDGSVGRGFVTKPDRNVPKPKHFDPLALGLMFPGELTTGESLPNIVQKYSVWNKGFVETDLGDGKVRFSGKTETRGEDFFVIVDWEKGIWPLEMAYGAEPIFQQKVSVDQFNGVWLPQDATFMQSDKSTKVTLEWKSINQPIADRLFDLGDVELKYDFSVKRK